MDVEGEGLLIRLLGEENQGYPSLLYSIWELDMLPLSS